MANSINTNTGAMIALQSLNQTNRDLGVTQNRINTGQKVSSAKDNGAIFAIATGQRAEMGALDAVKSSLNRGQSILDVGLAAGDSVISAMTELKSLSVAIADAPAHSADYVPASADYTPGTPANDGPDGINGNADDVAAVPGTGTAAAGTPNAARLALENDFDAIVSEINTALGGATFDGVNMFAANTAAISVTNGTAAGSTFELKAAGGAATTSDSLGLAAGTRTTAAVEGAIQEFTATLADFGTKSKSIDRQSAFTSKLQDSIESGIGNLVDADLAKESARLTALQTKQQLGVQALSIANQSSGILLSLFR